jgi:thiol-disulfide isomerase/thioredoxin
MSEPGPKPPRTWFLVAVGLAVAWIIYLILFGPRSGHEGPLPLPALKRPVPPIVTDYRWVLRDLQDAPVPFEKYKGRVVFLNLWATWCPPCVAELPAIANLASNPRLKDVAFLCVSTDESPEAVRSFLQDKNWPMTILRATDVPKAFATEAIPATFVIAPDGRVVAAEVGAAQWDDPSVVDFLEGLSKARAGSEETKP